jgi:hypothetical protein
MVIHIALYGHFELQNSKRESDGNYFSPHAHMAVYSGYSLVCAILRLLNDRAEVAVLKDVEKSARRP